MSNLITSYWFIYCNYSEPCKLRQNMLVYKHIWLNLYGEVTTWAKEKLWNSDFANGVLNSYHIFSKRRLLANGQIFKKFFGITSLAIICDQHFSCYRFSESAWSAYAYIFNVFIFIITVLYDIFHLSQQNSPILFVFFII